MKVRFTEQTHADVNSTFVNVEGDIKNFTGDSGRSMSHYLCKHP